MKKLSRGLLSLLLVLALCLIFTGCGEKTPTTIENVDRIVFEVTDQQVNIFYSNADYEKQTIYQGEYSEDNLGALIDRLDNDGVMAATSQTSTMGSYYLTVGNLQPKGTQYIYFYTNLVDYQEPDSEWSTTASFEDKVLKGANFGASSLPLSDGALYIILLLSGY